MDKIIFTGPVGSGKTTAIASISEVPPIMTEVRCSDEVKFRKETTTVALDYGYLTLDDGNRVHLYGTPGQERFNYMWTILCRGGIGLVLLIDNARSDPVADLVFYLDAFDEFIQQTGTVVGITRMDVSHQTTREDYSNKLLERGQIFPVFEIDARQANDVKVLIHALLALLQSA